jgi:hypothetical protein
MRGTIIAPAVHCPLEMGTRKRVCSRRTSICDEHRFFYSLGYLRNEVSRRRQRAGATEICAAICDPRAIPNRITDRGAFTPAPVPDNVQKVLREAAHVEGAWLHTITDAPTKERLASLIADADKMQFDSPSFRRELAGWLHSSRDKDGLPAYAKGAHELLGFAAPAIAFIVRTFDVGDGVAARDKELARGIAAARMPRHDAGYSNRLATCRTGASARVTDRYPPRASRFVPQSANRSGGAASRPERDHRTQRLSPDHPATGAWQCEPPPHTTQATGGSAGRRHHGRAAVTAAPNECHSYSARAREPPP